ncbi:MAG: ATP-grasp domain-containing protein [Nitriliruptorales bacterium]|nr:ATP-grasp domain-containing protein [Nitriliruptorales bacterium]
MARVLLLLPSATYRAADFMAAAKALGVEVVVASDHRQTLAGVIGDRALRIDLRHPPSATEAIVAHSRRVPLDAVVAVDDQGVSVAALAGARLGVAANPPEAVAATRDKAALRRALDAAGVAQPTFRVARPGDDVARLAVEVGVPCVVKPVSLSASRGVIRAEAPAEAATAAERVRAIVCEDEQDPPVLLVESYVPGAEVAVEGLLRGGALEVLAVFDKPDPMEGPYFEETLLVTPSRLPAPAQRAVVEAVRDATAAIGLVEGPVHAELRIRPDGGVAVLELAARSIGGLCSRTLRFGMGVSLEEVILRHALGRPVDALTSAFDASGVMMLPIPRAGTLVAVRGQNAARAVPGVAGLEITVPRGRPVRPLPEGDRYLGFLFARGETPAAVERALRAAHGHLDVVIEP